jgi:Putative zinc-finger
MDCHDARLLLAFTGHGGDQIDPTERDAVQQHLDTCADCAAFAQSEQIIDAAIGTAMRTVPIPAGAKSRVYAKLATTRAWPWRRIAAAAAILIGIGLGTAWYLRPLPQIGLTEAEYVINGKKTEPDDVEQWYRDQGIEMIAWRQLDYNLLWTYDVVHYQGQRVPKLIFYSRDPSAIAEVLVVRESQFDVRMPDGELNGQTPNQIFVQRENDAGYVYLVGTTAGLEPFLRRGAH